MKLLNILNEFIAKTDLFKSIRNIEGKLAVEKTKVRNLIVVVNRFGDADRLVKAFHEEAKCNVIVVSTVAHLDCIEIDHYIVANNAENNSQFEDIIKIIENRVSLGLG